MKNIPPNPSIGGSSDAYVSRNDADLYQPFLYLEGEVIRISTSKAVEFPQSPGKQGH